MNKYTVCIYCLDFYFFSSEVTYMNDLAVSLGRQSVFFAEVSLGCFAIDYLRLMIIILIY